MLKKTKNKPKADEQRPKVVGFTSYVGLVQRYRPRSFEDLIGQPEITEDLRAYFIEGTLHRAILLSGPPGVGKTSTARIIAACLNCEKAVDGPIIDPCGDCRECEGIFTGDSQVINEFDGTSGLTPRTLQQEIAAGISGWFRVNIFIFNEVEALSAQVLNVLHRPLEEPPRGVVFILCTTEPRRLLRSIRSRCQEVRLQQVPFDVLAAHLREIAEVEDADLPDETIRRVARQANGSVRSALNYLEREITRWRIET